MGVGTVTDQAVIAVNSKVGRYSKFVAALAGVILTGIFAGFSSKSGVTADVVAALVYILPNAEKVITGQ